MKNGLHEDLLYQVTWEMDAENGRVVEWRDVILEPDDHQPGTGPGPYRHVLLGAEAADA